MLDAELATIDVPVTAEYIAQHIQHLSQRYRGFHGWLAVFSRQDVALWRDNDGMEVGFRDWVRG